VRNLVWQVDGDVLTGADQDVAYARLSLSDSDATRALWPHSFALQLQVELGAGWVSVALNVTNTGDAAFDFTTALHTYLATPDVRNAGVAQLGNARFTDATAGNDEAIHDGSVLRIADETDNIYWAPPPALTLQQDGKPFLQIEQQGFGDSVIWNPGPAKAAQLGDMPAQDWTRMLCIEAAQIEHPVRLSPQATWRGLQRLTRAG
jgi:glucose-6-phosphate 1-epimerase